MGKINSINNIQSVKYLDFNRDSYVVTLVDGTIVGVPNSSSNDDNSIVTQWASSNVVSEPMDLATCLASTKNAVKIEAERRILNLHPEWKQRNFLADVVLVINKENQSYNDIQDGVQDATRYVPTTEEKVMIAAHQAAQTAINAIRTKSDEIETSLESLTFAQLEVFDVTDDSHWVQMAIDRVNNDVKFPSHDLLLTEVH